MNWGKRLHPYTVETTEKPKMLSIKRKICKKIGHNYPTKYKVYKGKNAEYHFRDCKRCATRDTTGFIDMDFIKKFKKKYENK